MSLTLQRRVTAMRFRSFLMHCGKMMLIRVESSAISPCRLIGFLRVEDLLRLADCLDAFNGLVDGLADCRRVERKARMTVLLALATAPQIVLAQQFIALFVCHVRPPYFQTRLLHAPCPRAIQLRPTRHTGQALQSSVRFYRQTRFQQARSLC